MTARLTLVLTMLLGALAQALWFSLIIWVYTLSNLGILPYSVIATVVTLLLKVVEKRTLDSWDEKKRKRDAEQIVAALTANTEHLDYKS